MRPGFQVVDRAQARCSTSGRVSQRPSSQALSQVSALIYTTQTKRLAFRTSLFTPRI
ncbi:hypothetical protein WG66_002241 [Moniliophthora roreri]|nr:hypothetical protein WG66_002241 [Moniliophthora roreri]